MTLQEELRDEVDSEVNVGKILWEEALRLGNYMREDKWLCALGTVRNIQTCIEVYTQYESVPKYILYALHVLVDMAFGLVLTRFNRGE